MATNHHTSKVNRDDLKYTGWNLSWKNPGDKHDPVMDALIRHRAKAHFMKKRQRSIEKYMNGQLSDPQIQGKTLNEFLIEEKFGEKDCEQRIEKWISECLPGYAESEWMAYPCTYTSFGEDGRVEWVSYTPQMSLCDGLGDFMVLENAGFVVSVDPVLFSDEMQLKITIQSPIGEDILPRHKDMPNNETWLYRMFDQDGILLYVGISQDAFVRFAQHARSKSWIKQVARWEREPFPSRQMALQAEKAAIEQESPLFNIAHNERAFR